MQEELTSQPQDDKVTTCAASKEEMILHKEKVHQQLSQHQALEHQQHLQVAKYVGFNSCPLLKTSKFLAVKL